LPCRGGARFGWRNDRAIAGGQAIDRLLLKRTIHPGLEIKGDEVSDGGCVIGTHDGIHDFAANNLGGALRRKPEELSMVVLRQKIGNNKA
jgi:hypothetical protein